jgi:hypothetical protein
MGRPPGYQWQPLGLDTDPVPGDPQAISQEAQHLVSVANTIASQVMTLRKIANDNTEVGQHAAKIRSSASSLAGSLQVVEARYRSVSSALKGWVPELEQAQSLSIRALNEAETPYARLSQAVILPSGPDLNAAEKQEVASYHTSVQRAQDQLNAAKALLTRATTLRDTKGAYYAAKINQASDDSLTDHESLWGDITSDFDHLVGDVAWELRDVCTGLEILATVAAVVAFALAQFVPGVDLIVDGIVFGAFFATLSAGVGRFVLADTHNGSWWDFGLDAFACLSFGSSRFLGAAAKILADGAEDGATSAMVTELVGGTGTKAAELARYAGMMGDDVGELAEKFGPKLAQTAVKVATADSDLTGGWKVMADLGSLSKESDQFARALAITTRFSDSMGGANILAKLALTTSGIGAGLAGLTGIGSLVGGGVEFDGPDGPAWPDWHIPGVSHWYKTTFEIPTGGS